jgi:hypothetical protein
MDAQAIKNLGGVLQIIGVVIVVWDLLVDDYLGDLGRLTAWLRARHAQVEAAVRWLLRRQRRTVVVPVGTAGEVETAGSLTVRKIPGPLVL